MPASSAGIATKSTMRMSRLLCLTWPSNPPFSRAPHCAWGKWEPCEQVLEEFYEGLATVGVSAMTGEGMDDFFAAVASCARDYEQHYLPELQRRQQARRPAVLSGLPVVS